MNAESYMAAGVLANELFADIETTLGSAYKGTLEGVAESAKKCCYTSKAYRAYGQGYKTWNSIGALFNKHLDQL